MIIANKCNGSVISDRIKRRGRKILGKLYFDNRRDFCMNFLVRLSNFRQFQFLISILSHKRPKVDSVHRVESFQRKCLKVINSRESQSSLSENGSKN